ncbi:MAG: biopolymer transporter ExbD [Deltaproteobacteria bacterium]
MAHRPSKKRHQLITDVNLTPLLNVFIIVIPFVLLSAVFVKTAVIDISLPQEGAKGQASADSPTGVLVIKVTGSGFDVGGIGKAFIPKQAGEYDFKGLTDELIKVKERFRGSEDAILLFSPDASYEFIVKVMDATRETTVKEDGKTKRRTLFPMVSLGETG